MERVLEIIRRDVAQDKVSIDTPTQNLESYFLEVVHKARQAAAQTSGAMSGATVAAYLRGGAESKPAGDKILERLTTPQPVQSAPLPEPAPVPVVDEKKLAALTQPTEPVKTTPAPAKSEPPAELEKANEKLSSLLGKQQ